MDYNPEWFALLTSIYCIARLSPAIDFLVKSHQFYYILNV